MYNSELRTHLTVMPASGVKITTNCTPSVMGSRRKCHISTMKQTCVEIHHCNIKMIQTTKIYSKVFSFNRFMPLFLSS